MENTKHFDIYQDVTDRIIALLKEGTVPWVQPWKGGRNMLPTNGSTNTPYSGVNILLLWAAGFQQSRWLTFKQVKFLKGSVRKGAKATRIVRVIPMEREEKDVDGNPVIDEETGEIKMRKFTVLKYFHVYNVEQCEGLPESLYDDVEYKDEERKTSEDVLKKVRSIADGMGIEVKLGDSAYYRPWDDQIYMPNIKSFESDEAYAATLLHELTHATGSESRLSRSGITGGAPFGSRPYANEELIAEMGSAFASAHLGINVLFQHVEQHAAYLKSWLQVLSEDKKFIFKASGEARKATEMLLSHLKTVSEEGQPKSEAA